jgi:hypothetical protein
MKCGHETGRSSVMPSLIGGSEADLRKSYSTISMPASLTGLVNHKGAANDDDSTRTSKFGEGVEWLACRQNYLVQPTASAKAEGGAFIMPSLRRSTSAPMPPCQTCATHARLRETPSFRSLRGPLSSPATANGRRWLRARSRSRHRNGSDTCRKAISYIRERSFCLSIAQPSPICPNIAGLLLPICLPPPISGPQGPASARPNTHQSP